MILAKDLIIVKSPKLDDSKEYKDRYLLKREYSEDIDICRVHSAFFGLPLLDALACHRNGMSYVVFTSLRIAVPPLKISRDTATSRLNTLDESRNIVIGETALAAVIAFQGRVEEISVL
jgi:hypothetical protein